MELLKISLLLSMLAIFYAVVSQNHVHCKEYYITTAGSVHKCSEGEPCLDLHQFSMNTTEFITEANLTLIFQAGHHHLNGSEPLMFQNITTLSMISEPNASSSVSIICGKEASFRFLRDDHVYISHLNFLGCNRNSVEHVNNFTVEDSSFTGASDTALTVYHIGTSVNLIRTTFKNNTGIRNKLGGAIFASKSELKIRECSFDSNLADSGGALSIDLSNLTISDSIFTNNAIMCDNSYQGALCNGGALFIHDLVHYTHTALLITNTSFINNTATVTGSGGAISMKHPNVIII